LIDLPKAERQRMPRVIDVDHALYTRSFCNHALLGVGGIFSATSSGRLAAFVGSGAYVEPVFAIIEQEGAIDLGGASRGTADIDELVNRTLRLCGLRQPNRDCNADCFAHDETSSGPEIFYHIAQSRPDDTQKERTLGFFSFATGTGGAVTAAAGAVSVRYALCSDAQQRRQTLSASKDELWTDAAAPQSLQTKGPPRRATPLTPRHATQPNSRALAPVVGALPDARAPVAEPRTHSIEGERDWDDGNRGEHTKSKQQPDQIHRQLPAIQRDHARPPEAKIGSTTRRSGNRLKSGNPLRDRDGSQTRSVAHGSAIMCRRSKK